MIEQRKLYDIKLHVREVNIRGQERKIEKNLLNQILKKHFGKQNIYTLRNSKKTILKTWYSEPI